MTDITISESGCPLSDYFAQKIEMFHKQNDLHLQTPLILFLNYLKNLYSQVSLCMGLKLNMKNLKKKNYSWNYKDYYTESLKYGNIKYIELEKLCNIDYGERIVKKDSNDGIYPVYGGGVITFTSQALNPNTNFTVVVGAGGAKSAYDGWDSVNGNNSSFSKSVMLKTWRISLSVRSIRSCFLMIATNR